MKFKSLPKVLVALFVTSIFSIAFYSCKEEAILDSEQTIKSYDEKFLEFKDSKEFTTKLSEIAKMKRVDLDKWESSQGFTSMRNIYESILDIELKTIEEEDLQIKKDPSLKLKMQHKFSEIYKQNKDNIKLTSYGFEINAPNLLYAGLINKDGIVKIGGVIHQFSNNKVKAIKSGDKNKINELNKFQEEGVYGDIEVRKIITNTPIFQKNARPNWEGRCDSDDGSYWLTGWLTYQQTPQWHDATTQITIISTLITSRHLRKTWLGWIDHQTTSYSYQDEEYLSLHFECYELEEKYLIVLRTMLV